MPRDAKTLKKPEPVYLVKHEGPNRATRRAMQKAINAYHRKQATWRRQLIRAGINPDRVLLQRAIKQGLIEAVQKTVADKTEEVAASGQG